MSKEVFRNPKRKTLHIDVFAHSLHLLALLILCKSELIFKEFFIIYVA